VEGKQEKEVMHWLKSFHPILAFGPIEASSSIIAIGGSCSSDNKL
jgi:hypothetical protein